MSTTSRAAVFGAALAALWSAHDLADHVIQTDHQAANKASDWTAMAGHVGSYHAVQVAALLGLRTLGVRPSWWRLAAGVAFSAATHALLDRRWPVTAILERTGSPRFAQLHTPINGPYQGDQALHHLCLMISAFIVGGGHDE